MHLDVVTLMAAGSFVAALSGLLLTGAWTQIEAAPALVWWAAAKYVFAIGVGLLAYGTGSGAISILAIGGIVASVAPALMWAGTRTFVGRRVSPVFLVGGIVIWIAAAAFFRESAQEPTTIIGFGAWIVYLTAANWELWRSRGEPLNARWPLMATLSLHVAIFVGGIYDILFNQMLSNLAAPMNSWFGLIYFEGIVYAIVSAIFMIVLCKERSEISHLKLAQNDALTGIASRGIFFLSAERLLARSRTDNTPLSVIVFDLDRFKSINDTHGHPMGDRVLRIFVDTARGVLRPNDLFGRHGGEEFAVVLPGATVETAYVIADRIRQAFAQACREVDGLPIYSTVSAGVAAASLKASFSVAIEAADMAMYRAKNRGRNRVECIDLDRPHDNVVRVA